MAAQPESNPPENTNVSEIDHISKKLFTIISSILTVILIIGAVVLSKGHFTQTTEQTAKFIQANAITLPSYYKENMVFQQGKSIRIHGSTSQNATITVTLSDAKTQRSSTVQANDNGEFTITLQSLKGRMKPYSLTITSGDKTLKTIKHVYIGNVFLAAGQSNMEVNYFDYYNSEDEQHANFSGAADVTDLPEPIDDTHIFFLVSDHQASAKTTNSLPLRSYNADSWLPANASNADYLGYLPQLFAERIRSDNPDIPVGIIQTAWGGTEIARHMAGGDIYNSHVAPLSGFNLAGILWYQGEQDGMADDMALAYQYNFAELIREYRDCFNDAELPFLYVQLSRFPGNDDWAKVRQAQFAVAVNAAGHENTAMTVSLDTDKGTNAIIHPMGKEFLAYRMAKQWEAMVAKRTIPNGPLATRATSDDGGSTVTVSFTKGTANRLQVRRPNYSKQARLSNLSRTTDASLSGFEVAGKNGVYHTATASIRGNTIRITSDDVNEIRQVRYLWAANPDCDTLLYNSYDLPASPFTLSVTEN